VPLLSGFFSKDEILFRTYTAESTPGHTLMWAVGMVTSLLTAIYMFRLVFMTFHGERRHDAPAVPAHPEEEEPVAHGHGAHDAHGHAHDLPAGAGSHAVLSHAPAAKDDGHGHGHGGGHDHLPHEAPWSMAIPLILLAIGSVVAGYVGVPHALGGHNRIETFLEPSFEAHAAAGREAAAPENAREIVEVGSAEGTHADTGTELNLMILSSGVALAGIGIAMYFWLRSRRTVDSIAASAAPVHRLLLGKYYVDELYDAAIVQPVKALSTAVLWKGVDAGLIDGAVNGVGSTISGAAGVLRRTQTGSVRTYAFALFAGAVGILAYYLFI